MPLPRHAIPAVIALTALTAPSGVATESIEAPLRAALEAIDPARIDADLRFLSDDALEGRGTGQPGGRTAALYLEARMRLLGLKPGAGDGYLQDVPLVGVETLPDTRLTFSAGGRSFPPEWQTDYVANTETQREIETIDAPLVFAGYGVVAPEYGWDDFKGVDVRGAVLILLVNDPPSPDPKHFGGRGLTYYGRWTYKFESAARAGAAGAILVHTDESAGYGWSVVRNSWGRERPYVAIDPSGPRPLQIAAWVTDGFARRIVQAAGKDLDVLRAGAARADFRPVRLDAGVKGRMVTRVRPITTWNVLGILPGSDPRLLDEFVVYTAHYDHLGRGAAEDGDDIYNGAADNASGVATMLEAARALTLLPKAPRRSVLFFACAAEEGGLRGSEFYVRHPTVPPGRIAANINLDGMPVWGRPRDFTLLGAERSSLDPIVREAAERLDFRPVPDAHAEQGFFYRSDQFNFARAGVPALSIEGGVDYVGRPPGYGEQLFKEYRDKRYHRPSDEYDPDFDLSGAAAAGRIALYIGYRVAQSDAAPRWNKGDEFEAARLRSLSGTSGP